MGPKVPFNVRPQAPRIIIQSEEGVAHSNIVKNFKVGYQNHGIIYVKGNTIPHVNAQSSLRFQCENGEEHENSEDRIIQWVETDVLSRKTLSRETRH